MGNRGSADKDHEYLNERPEKLEDLYTIHCTKLGRGHYATVWKGTCKRTKRPVAIKRMRKSLTDEKRLRSEINALRKIGKQENIVELIDVFETVREVQLVLELCTGGELFERLASKGPYSEADCVKHIKSMAEAVLYMHDKGIVHRDLKPENILLSSDNEDTACIKIADFGLAKLTNDQRIQTKCGTWGYSAPEMVSGSNISFGYDAKVDSWSIGTIAYILLCGYHPFDPLGKCTDHEMMGLIKNCKFDYEDEAWNGISEKAKDFIRHLLVLDPNKRYSMTELLVHPWIQGKSGVDIPVTPLSPTIHRDLARYQERSKEKFLSPCGNGDIFVEFDCSDKCNSQINDDKEDEDALIKDILNLDKKKELGR